MIIRLFFIISFILTSQAFANSDYKHAISTFGDYKYAANFQHFDYVNPNAPKGGVVKFGSEGGFNNLNQFLLKGLPASGLSYLYDSLMEGSDDEISTRYPLIAEGYRFYPDENSIEFKLNPKARFHDGKQILADDVVFTFEILTTKGHPSYKMMFREVEKVQKISSHRVKFFFKKNYNRDLPVLVASLPILPKHYYEKVDFEKTTLEPPLASGPYKIREVKPNRSISYERVKDYWAWDLPVIRGRYNFDEIIFDYYRDGNVLIEAFKSQKFDLRQENVARNWAKSYNIEAIKKGEIIKKFIPHSLPAPMQAFVFNLRREKFQNIALRHAITYAFDFEWLNKHIFYDQYKRTESYFANSDFGYKGFKLPVSQGDGFNRENLVKAKEILDKAGYKLVDGSLIDPKNGQKVTLEILIVSDAFKMIVAPFIKHLQKLGIDATARFIEENQYQTRVNNFDFDMVVAVYGQALLPGSELFAYFHSSQKDVKGSRNLSGLSDELVDSLVERISHSKSKKELKLLCQKLDKHLLENYVMIPQLHNNSYRILYRNIFEMPKKTPKYSLAVDAWWIK